MHSSTPSAWKSEKGYFCLWRIKTSRWLPCRSTGKCCFPSGKQSNTAISESTRLMNCWNNRTAPLFSMLAPRNWWNAGHLRSLSKGGRQFDFETPDFGAHQKRRNARETAFSVYWKHGNSMVYCRAMYCAYFDMHPFTAIWLFSSEISNGAEYTIVIEKPQKIKEIWEYMKLGIVG